MVKVGGKRNTCKTCKTREFFENRGKFVKVGGENNNFRETGGKCTEAEKIWGKFENRGEIEICGRWLKKEGHKKFYANENREIFREKLKLWTFSAESENFSENRREIWKKMHPGIRGDGLSYSPRPFILRTSEVSIVESILESACFEAWLSNHDPLTRFEAN